MNTQNKNVFVGLIALVVMLIDQATKTYVHSTYMLGESTTLIPGFFNITYVRNLGAAFGFLGQSNADFRTLFFLVMPPIAMGIIFVILKGVNATDRFQQAALACVLGGALGNYIDRLRFQYVIDFLDVHWRDNYTWPAFNIADSAIVGGMFAMILILLRDSRRVNHLNASGN